MITSWEAALGTVYLLTKAGAVHKGKFLDFFNLSVRNVDFLQQFTIVTGMRPQHLEVPRQLQCSYPTRA